MAWDPNYLEALSLGFLEAISINNSITFSADFGLNPGQHLLESGLTHLNKERATRPKGRRPPSKASVLAHLVIEESIISEDPPDDEDDVKEKKSNNQLQAPTIPKPL